MAGCGQVCAIITAFLLVVGVERAREHTVAHIICGMISPTGMHTLRALAQNTQPQTRPRPEGMSMIASTYRGHSHDHLLPFPLCGNGCAQVCGVSIMVIGPMHANLPREAIEGGVNKACYEVSQKKECFGNVAHGVRMRSCVLCTRCVNLRAFWWMQ